MKATLAGHIIAEADDADIVRIEGNAYFPPSSIAEGVLIESPTPYTCPWKGAAQYYSAKVDGETHLDAAWSYPTPHATAIDRVGADFSGYIAFSPGVTVGN